MSRTDPQLNFRCPADLKERLETAAARSHRSLTQEIVARLETTLQEAGEQGTSPQEQNIRAKAELLLEDAAAAGVVLTIEQRPLQPLGMGNYETVVSVRPARGAS